MLNVGLIGAGRMGRALIRAIAATDDLELCGLCVRAGSPQARQDAAAIAADPAADFSVETRPAAVARLADVLIDFSLPAATAAVAAAALAERTPLVCGVTGIDDRALAALGDAATRVPVLYDRNMSLGIAVLETLAPRAMQALGEDCRITIRETHHRHKRDAPSGTALKLGEALARSRGVAFADVYRYDTGGGPGAPSPGAIAFEVTREGDNPGEHTVVLATGNEVLELTHRVTDRSVFAEGALRAARWLVSRPPGLYRIADLAG